MFSYQFVPICDVPYNKNPKFVKICYWEDDDKTFVNFSFNDGCKSQKKISQLFDQYNLKCTFFIISGYMDDDFLQLYIDNRVYIS